MVGVLVGLPIGIVVGFLCWGVASMLDDCVSWQFRGVMNVVGIVVMAAIIVMSPFIGYAVEWNSHQKFIEQYKMVEETIESSLESTELSGYERLELVNTALEYNESLVSKQHSAQKWYGFAIPDEILELKPIAFWGEVDG